VAEVRERHHGPVGDPQQLVQHVARPARGLQGLGQHRVVEGAVGEVVEVLVGVALHHRQAARHAGGHTRGADLQPPAVDLLFLGQQVQQHALAAADVQHAGAWADEAQDLLEVFADHRRPPPVGGVSSPT
jgi:hypothetical protein